MTLKLLVENRTRPGPGLRFELTIHDSIAIVGREGCDLTLKGDRISRQHAAFVIVKGGVMVRDLRSTNGLFLNDRRVLEAAVKSGSRIRVGSYILTVLAVVDEAGRPQSAPRSEGQTVIAATGDEPVITYIEQSPTNSDLDQVKREVLRDWPGDPPEAAPPPKRR
jgi:pSer/pThr/pTyr-binding forkhead associated (FHA) protein